MNTMWTHLNMFRTQPDINTVRLTFSPQLSFKWQVCTTEHINLQHYQTITQLKLTKEVVIGNNISSYLDHWFSGYVNKETPANKTR